MSLSSDAAYSERQVDPSLSAGRIPQRRRRSALALSLKWSIYEWTSMILLLLPATAGIILFGAVHRWSVGTFLLFVFIGVVMYAIRPLLDRQLTDVRIPPGGLILVVMLVYTGVSIPFASVPYEARVDFLYLASFVGAYWAWAEWSSRFSRWRIILFLLLLVATLVALYALIMHARGSMDVLYLTRHEQYGMRASGTFRAPALLGAYMGSAICIALALVLTPASGWFLRIFSGYSLLMCLPALYLSGSRSGWFGTLLGVPVVLLMMSKKSLRAFLWVLIGFPVVAVGLLALLWFADPMFHERVSSGLSVEGSASWRIDTWKDTWVMIQDAPIWGFGPGSYRWRYSPYQSWQANMWVDFAHNEYVHLWADYGLVGVLIMAWLIITVLIRCMLMLRKAELARDIALIAACTGTLAAALGHAVFDFNFHILSLVHVVIIMAGITMGTGFRSELLRVRSLPYPILCTTGGVGALAALVAAFLSFQIGASGVFLLRAEREAQDVDMFQPNPFGEVQQLLRRAIQINPSYWVPYLEMGDIYRRRAVWVRDPEYRAELYEQALHYYRLAYERNPWDMNVVYGIGRSYFFLGDYEQSIQYLTRTVEHTPTHIFFSRQLGVQLREMGQYEEALKMFEQSHRTGGWADPIVRSNLRWLRERVQNTPDS